MGNAQIDKGSCKSRQSQVYWMWLTKYWSSLLPRSKVKAVRCCKSKGNSRLSLLGGHESPPSSPEQATPGCGRAFPGTTSSAYFFESGQGFREKSVAFGFIPSHSSFNFFSYTLLSLFTAVLSPRHSCLSRRLLVLFYFSLLPSRLQVKLRICSSCWIKRLSWNFSVIFINFSRMLMKSSMSEQSHQSIGLRTVYPFLCSTFMENAVSVKLKVSIIWICTPTHSFTFFPWGKWKKKLHFCLNSLESICFVLFC